MSFKIAVELNEGRICPKKHPMVAFLLEKEKEGSTITFFQVFTIIEKVEITKSA